MSNQKVNDVVVGRIVVEFSKQYIILYLCDHAGRVLDWDSFKYGEPLEAEVATEERDSFWHILYDYSNTIVNHEPESEEKDERTEDG